MNLTNTESKVLKAVASGKDTAKDISKAAKVGYGTTRTSLTYLKKFGLVAHLGDPFRGSWELTQEGKKALEVVAK